MAHSLWYVFVIQVCFKLLTIGDENMDVQVDVSKILLSKNFLVTTVT